MEVYVGVHVGTTRIHALSLAEDGRMLQLAHVATPVGSDGMGPVHEAFALEQLVARAVDEAVGAVHGARLAGIALTSFGDEGFFLDRAEKVLYPAIAWYDRRPSRSQTRWLDRHSETEVFERTGLLPDLRHPLMQWHWMLDHVPDVLRSTSHYFSVSEYLAYRLTGEAASTPSQAARTLVFDVSEGRYISEWLRDVELWKDIMPPLRPGGAILGELASRALPGTGRMPRVPVVLAGYDRAVAPIALGPGEAGRAVGLSDRGEWVSLVRAESRPDRGGLMCGLEFGPGVPGTVYRVSGRLRTERSLEAWERTLGREREVLERMAERVPPGSQGVRFRPGGSLPLPGTLGRAAVPGLSDGPSREGVLSGLPIDVDTGLLWRAVLEGWALHLRDMLSEMQGTAGSAVTSLHMLNEARLSLLTLRIRSSVLGIPIHVLEVPDAPALGAAILAARACGVLWAQGENQPKASRVLHIEPDQEWLEVYGGGMVSTPRPTTRPA